MASLTLLAWLTMVGAVVFAILFALTFMGDGESDTEEPTLNTRNDRDP